jgi:Flp pilus assembly protein TadG
MGRKIPSLWGLVDTRNRPNNGSSQRGATTIQVLVILVPVLFGLIGFAVDLGQLYMARSELKTAANTMALAAATRLIGTDQAIVDATTAAKVPIDTTTGFGNQYYFNSLPIGQVTGSLGSSAPDPTFYASLSDALTGSNAGGGGNAVKYAQVTLTADVPLTFWRFISNTATSTSSNNNSVIVQTSAVAGVSAPLCTACSIEPLAVGAVDTTDTTDFGFVQGTIYTFGYSCTGNPVPSGLADSQGATARIPYLILDRYNTADTNFPDENSQLERALAGGMPGSNPTLGLLSNSSSQPISCFNINNSTIETVWADATPGLCSGTVASPVSSAMCGLDLRFEPSPSGTFSTVCSGIPNASTIETIYSQDTDLNEEDAYPSYSGNGRRLITISIVDTLTPTSGMTVLGFRQFLLQPNLNLTTLNPTDTNGRFLAMYVGTVAPVPQGSFGNCGVVAGPGKVVLHQ